MALFIKNWDYTFNANDVAQYVNSKLKENYTTSLIRKIMKTEFN